MWAENSLAGIGKRVAGLGAKTYEAYADAETAAVTLLVVIRELKKRVENEL